MVAHTPLILWPEGGSAAPGDAAGTDRRPQVTDASELDHSRGNGSRAAGSTSTGSGLWQHVSSMSRMRLAKLKGVHLAARA